MCNTLPIVNPGIGSSLQHSILESFSDPNMDEETYVEIELSKIEKVNPVISQFIFKYSEHTDDPIGSALCGIMTYQLLLSQTEVNLMELDN